jgi:CO/xanthine dehydrogenase Mo-binding subunit
VTILARPAWSNIAVLHTRRQFLEITALGGGALLATFKFAESAGAAASAAPAVPLGAFVRIHADNTVVIGARGCEIGQGVRTSLPMLIAEELEVRWDQVRVEQLDYGIQAGEQPGSFSNRYGAQFAGGSTNISDGWQPLREAGAQVRALLIAAAAQAWSAAPGSLSARDGVVHHADGRSATYGELATRAAKLPPPAGPFALKDPRDFRIIGHPAKTADGADIVSGRARYGIDASVPAMLIWTRADDLQNDFYRPFGVHRLRAALGADGRVLGWSHRIAATSRKFRSDMADAPDWVGTLDVDGFPAGCVPNYLAEFIDVPFGLARGWWRAPLHTYTDFAIQGFDDEAAAAAGRDPLELRLEMLGEARDLE